MDTFTLTPTETVLLCFGTWAKVAEICGLARGQVPQRWTTVPSKHMPALIAASRSDGLFVLDANMLAINTQFSVGARSTVAA